MPRFLIKKSLLSGAIEIPPSKSQSLRAILFGALASGKTVIRGYLKSPDIDAMIRACRLFGAKIEVSLNEMTIEGTAGKIAEFSEEIDAGNSGIVLRFCSAVGSLASHQIVITGDESIQNQRPMQPLLHGLSQLGVICRERYLIQGPLKSGKTVVNGEDSQVVSALLIAGAFGDGSIQIDVKNPGETPWVTLTLDWLKRLGIPFENHGFSKYQVFGKSCYKGFEYDVPGDFSSAAFPIAAALITQSEITLNNLDMNDPQGDKKLIEILQTMGGNIEISQTSIQVKKGSHLKGIAIDVNDLIDALPILAVIGCYADGETYIYNGKVARTKECDRIHCIASELKKMGADIEETEDGLKIKKSELRGNFVRSHNDHRIAMSLAVAGLGALGETEISSVNCVKKTYPSFREDFASLGAKF